MHRIFRFLEGRKAVKVFGVALAAMLFVVNPALAAPTITSLPPVTSLTADDSFIYQLVVSDPAGERTYGLDHAPDGMVISQTGQITWEPSVAGDYRVVVTVADDNGEYATQPFRLTITSGKLVRLAIQPNDRPTIVKKGETRKFTVQGFDTEDNAVTIDRAEWTASGDVGTIDADGVFSAQRGGIAEITASVGGLEASVGAVVTDSQETPAAPKGTVLGETATSEDDLSEPQDENSNALSQAVTNEADTATENATCANWATWSIWLMLVVYAVAILAYYRFTAKRPTPLWWVFPALVTIIGLIVYSKYFCSGTYLWWPWAMLAIGVVATLGMAPRKPLQQQS